MFIYANVNVHILDKRKKINVNFYFNSSLWYIKNTFWWSLCQLQKLFEVPQRSEKIKNLHKFFRTNFFETLRSWRVKNPAETYLQDPKRSFCTLYNILMIIWIPKIFLDSNRILALISFFFKTFIRSYKKFQRFCRYL